MDGYSACSWTDNRDGTSTASVTIHFRDGRETEGDFQTRGIALYRYDRNGVATPAGPAAERVVLNGIPNVHEYWSFGPYQAYTPLSGDLSWKDWKVRDPFVANVQVILKNSKIADWPGIGIRAVNASAYDQMTLEPSGAAYISRDAVNTPCTILSDPSTPPVLPTVIKVTAPDWNLGELPRGAAKKTFSRVTEQLCFTYTGADVSEKSFIINAGNANGLVSGFYQLKHLSDPSQVVPYTVILDSGSSQLTLPNNSNVARSFDTSGKTCFVPSFWTAVAKDVKDGDYSDVLTFTVFTKS
ncbi:hypothetical protein [Burkholderia territorii]|uniref:hypothetical protein n=1 Tax=Burkholderia territorii TaxID=1503055 RepID=UPI0012D930CB|nr:hypothetical protein [Burkholderia territorii]